MKALSAVLLLLTHLAHAEMVNTLSEDQKSELKAFMCSSGDTTCSDRSLQKAIQSHVQGSGLQITSFAAPGTFSSGSVGFTFKDADPSNQVSFKCTFNQLHETDASLTNCSGTESKTGKPVSISTFNKVSANNPAQNTIRLNGLLTPNADTTAGLPTPSPAGNPDASK